MRSRVLYVVETVHGQVWVGQIRKTDKSITVYSGFNGRPPVINIADVTEIVPADKHPDVVLLP